MWKWIRFGWLIGVLRFEREVGVVQFRLCPLVTVDCAGLVIMTLVGGVCGCAEMPREEERHQEVFGWYLRE
jgi:hypothetical protein